MDSEHVVRLLYLYLDETEAEADEGDRALFARLAADGIALLRRRLRPEVDLDADAGESTALEAAAAAMAYHQACLLLDAKSPKSLSTGELRAEMPDRSAAAARLMDEKLRAVRHLLKEERFYFGSVRA